MTSGKAPGADGIPAEVLKHGGSSLVTQFTNLISKIWDEEAVPQDFKDALNVWNTLPSDRIDFSSFAAFKRTIQQIDLSTFLLCY